MKQYTGTKTLMAVAMTLGAYNDLRGWSLPSNEDPNKEGYLVEYPLVGEDDKTNVEGYKGYVSWSPKSTFEASYQESGTLVDRVLIETRDVATRLNALNTFMASDVFPTLERSAKSKLYRQQRYMSKYVEVLGERLEEMNTQFSHRSETVMKDDDCFVDPKDEDDNYNPDTVGTATPVKNEGIKLWECTYGDAINHMLNGGAVQRKDWFKLGMYVFKQVPSKVPTDVVPKMSSLPDAIKDRMIADRIEPNYQNQMVIVKRDGSIDSWVASSADTFATDWVLLHE